MPCEMCGKAESFFRIVVEGTELIVCDACKKFGKLVGKVKTEPYLTPKKSVVKKDVVEEVVVNDYGKKMKSARESFGKTQDEFAQFVGEKVSIIRKIEAQQFEPSLDMAKKFERLLKIKLVESVNTSQESEKQSKQKKNDYFTIGDMIQVKKRA